MNKTSGDTFIEITYEKYNELASSLEDEENFLKTYGILYVSSNGDTIKYKINNTRQFMLIRIKYGI